LPDSTPERISGGVEIMATLASGAAAEPQALADLLATWVRAVEIGFFGPARIRLHAPIAAAGRTVSGRVDCEDVSGTAFRALSLLIRHFSHVSGQVERLDVIHEAGFAVAAAKTSIPALPESIPFPVEYPEDLKHYVRVEMEFRRPLTPTERDAIFGALSVWDVMIEAFGPEESWGRPHRYESRLFSPSMVEHEVNGYHAGFECLSFVVWLGLRLHRKLAIDRLTME
jgi:hypothetical protein